MSGVSCGRLRMLNACLRQLLLGDETDGLCMPRVIAQSRDKTIHQGESGSILSPKDISQCPPRAYSISRK
jgi:hypothetical protein